MKYYTSNQNGVTVYGAVPDTCVVSEDEPEITEEEFNTAIAALQTAAEEEAALTPTYSELEAENAALLYQLLTGEEFTEDV